MGRFVNPDNSAFQVALNSEFTWTKLVCWNIRMKFLIPRMPIFATAARADLVKSYTANMLAAYYSKGCDSENMFSGLQIGRSRDFKTHLNQYDVIHIDIQWFLTNCETPEQMVAFITKIGFG